MASMDVASATAGVASDPATALREAEARWFAACGVDVRERYLTLARPQMRLRVLECGEGAPTLHVHGGGAFAAVNVPLAQAMPGRRHLMIDRPGFGLSDYVPVGRDVRRQSIDLLASTLDALQLESADFVANSIGAAMTFWFALAYPKRVRSISCVGGAAMIGEEPAAFFFRLLGTPVIGPFLLNLEPPSDKQVRNLWSRFGHNPARLDPTILAVTVAAERVPAYARAWREIIQATVSSFGSRPGLEISNEEIRGVQCPVAFAWGERDPMVPVPVGQRVAKILKAPFKVIPGGGHLPWFEDARAVADAIEPILAPRA